MFDDVRAEEIMKTKRREVLEAHSLDVVVDNGDVSYLDKFTGHKCTILYDFYLAKFTAECAASWSSDLKVRHALQTFADAKMVDPDVASATFAELDAHDIAMDVAQLQEQAHRIAAAQMRYEAEALFDINDLVHER